MFLSVLFTVSILSLISKSSCQFSESQMVRRSALDSSLTPQRFGAAIGFYQDNLLVGSPTFSISGENNTGYSILANISSPTFQTIDMQVTYPINPNQMFGGFVTLGPNLGIVGGPSQSLLFYTVNSGGTWSSSPNYIQISLSAGITSLAADPLLIVLGFANSSNLGSLYALYFNGTQILPLYPVSAPSGCSSGCLFGSSVAIGTSYVVVGAAGANSIGSIYLLTRTGGTTNPGISSSSPVELPQITGAVGATKMGSTVAISSDQTLIAGGAPAYGNGGGAWVYSLNNAQNWAYATSTPLHSLVSLPAGALFGTSISISDTNVVAVGAPGAGILYLFRKNSTGAWYNYASYVGNPLEEFGFSSAIYDNRIVVGAPGNNGSSSEGSVYLAYIDCDPSFFGPACSPCTCVTTNGVCSDGLTGSGTCQSCNPGYYGTNCESACNCTGQTECEDGVSGSGVCVDCTNKYGKGCAYTCTCQNGVCSNGFNGDGLCLLCFDGFGSPTCVDPCPLTCVPGTCFQNITGNGTCAECLPDTYGPYCYNCSCVNGTCSDGVNGNGKCLSCYSGNYGPYCNLTCDKCDGGNCSDGITGDGSCTCPSGQILNSSRVCIRNSSPSSPSNSSQANANSSPIPGVNQTDFLLIVILAPIGFVLILVLASALVWKFVCGPGERKFESDEEESVSV